MEERSLDGNKKANVPWEIMKKKEHHVFTFFLKELVKCLPFFLKKFSIMLVVLCSVSKKIITILAFCIKNITIDILDVTIL